MVRHVQAEQNAFQITPGVGMYGHIVVVNLISFNRYSS